jgi:hypothetical protein
VTAVLNATSNGAEKVALGTEKSTGSAAADAAGATLTTTPTRPTTRTAASTDLIEDLP